MSPTLLIAGGLAVGGALGVILSRTPVHSVVSLIVNLIGLAGLYLSLHAEFLAIVQVIVYAGAVMILFLFVIALLTVKREPLERAAGRGWTGRALLTLVASAAFAGLLALTAVRFDPVSSAAITDDFGTVATFGRELLVTHVLSFETAALILMVALVGVVVLVGRRQSQGGN